ncbi:MAG: addiction module toxin RelE [Nitrospirae bacterium]|nr:MAG: addiction module toxin RelE [Nitrospirota bacterium]
MARPLRLEYAGALYHVTAWGNAGQAIYEDDADRVRFLELLAREIAQQRWRCYAYCLMDNHYHLLLETPEPNLSRGMRRLNGVYTQWFNRRHGRSGHVLQGRFKSILVEKERYLREACRDIVLTPVRAGLVRSVGDWRWSSYRATAGQQRVPAWLAVEEVLRGFDADRQRACRAYRQFVRARQGQPSLWEQVRGQIFLGSDRFVARMERLLHRASLAKVPAGKRQPGRLQAREVLTRVAAVYRLRVADLVKRVHPEAYQVAAWLLRRVANESVNAVAHRFGVSPSRISHIQRALESRGRERSAKERQAMSRCHVQLEETKNT